MGCSTSINQNQPHLKRQQPIRTFNNEKSQIFLSTNTKIIKLSKQQNDSINTIQTEKSQKQNRQDNKGGLNNKTESKQGYKKRQQQIKYLKNNKDFVQLSIETSYCVNRVLNALAQNQILEDRQVKNLLSKNNQILQQKQNRYKNLQARQQKMEQMLKKQINRLDKTTKTIPNNYVKKQRNNSSLFEKTYDNQYSDIQKHKKTIENVCSDKENKENSSRSYDNMSKDYKSKFMSKIDKFRTEINTIMSKQQLGL